MVLFLHLTFLLVCMSKVLFHNRQRLYLETQVGFYHPYIVALKVFVVKDFQGQSRQVLKEYFYLLVL